MNSPSNNDPPEYIDRVIESGYRDGFGNWRELNTTTRDLITRVVSQGSTESSFTRILPEGQSADRSSPGQIRLEKGATVAYSEKIPADLPIGYHTEISDEDGVARLLIVYPEACFLPSDLKIWGWAIQSYALRAQTSWGIGDFSSLEAFAQIAAERGASMLQINPVAAVTPTLPQTDSPYFPTSRRFLNPIFLDVAKVAETTLGVYDLHSLQADAVRLNEDRIIDRSEVFRLKMQALEPMWEEAILDLPFKRYLTDRGDSLERFAVFCALSEVHGSDYRRWPTEFRHPHTAEVAEFGSQNLKRVRFFQWLQWHAEMQLSQVDDRIDLVCDLPIGFDPGGFDAWEWQDVLARDMAIGAPPDAFNSDGQNWGIPPLIPTKLDAVGYQPFIDTIRANLRNAGGLRIDHVMGLYRLFWIPNGMDAADGTYVNYPKDVLLAILCLESQRAGSWIAGEDLGTVPEGMQEDLERRNLLSHRLALFTDERPSEFPRKTIAAVTTHDLPTIAGLLSGAERESLKRIGMAPDDKELDGMVQAVRRTAGVSDETPLTETIECTYQALATSNSAVVVANLEDALKIEERPNVPGTTNEWPNWRLSLLNTVGQIADDRLFNHISSILSEDNTP